MALALIIAVIALAKHSKALPSPTGMEQRPCVNLTLPIPITANNGIYDVLPVSNNIEAVAYEIDLDTLTNAPLNRRLIANNTISGTYNIHGTLCVPPKGEKKSTLQILVHGMLTDSRYWDVRYKPEEYSYVDAAMGAGYSVFFYDRLGYGQSDKPDAYRVVQAPAQVEILRCITKMARDGELMEYASKTPTSYPSARNMTASFDKIIHWGHNMGASVVLNLLNTSDENVTDAAISSGVIPSTVLTNNSYNIGLVARALDFARSSDPTKFGDRGDGYMVPGSQPPIQALLLSSRTNETTGIGGFEPEILDLAFENRQPLAAPEIPSSLQIAITAPQYKGPLQFVLGEFDFLFCRGDCRPLVANTTFLEGLYGSRGDKLNVHLQPGTGEALTMHRNATMGYQVTFDWLERNGL